MLDLLISLRRSECTEKLARKGHLSPRESLAAKTRLALVRDTIPAAVLSHYEAMKLDERELLECPAIFAMAVLVSTYRALPTPTRKTLNSFFDLAGRRPRRRG
jgi:hypothetical protein